MTRPQAFRAVCRHRRCVLPTRLSFGTAHRKRRDRLSHFRQTLRPGVPALPAIGTSLDAAGQWPVCTREPHLPRNRLHSIAVC